MLATELFSLTCRRTAIVGLTDGHEDKNIHFSSMLLVSATTVTVLQAGALDVIPCSGLLIPIGPVTITTPLRADGRITAIRADALPRPRLLYRL